MRVTNITSLKEVENQLGDGELQMPYRVYVDFDYTLTKFDSTEALIFFANHTAFQKKLKVKGLTMARVLSMFVDDNRHLLKPIHAFFCQCSGHAWVDLANEVSNCLKFQCGANELVEKFAPTVLTNGYEPWVKALIGARFGHRLEVVGNVPGRRSIYGRKHELKDETGKCILVTDNMEDLSDSWDHIYLLHSPCQAQNFRC